MTKNSFKQFGLFFLFAMLIGIPASGNADSSNATSGKSVRASVKFRVIIPATLSLQVGTLQQNSSPSSQSVKDEISPSTTTTNQKGIWVKAFGNVKKKGTVQLLSTAFNSDNNGLSSRNVQYLWTAGKNTAPEQTELSKNRNKFSLSTSQSGQYFHVYSSQNITPQQVQSAPRFYILCSP